MKTKYNILAPDDTGDTDANINLTHQNVNKQSVANRQNRKMRDWRNWIMSANPERVLFYNGLVTVAYMNIAWHCKHQPVRNAL